MECYFFCIDQSKINYKNKLPKVAEKHQPIQKLYIKKLGTTQRYKGCQKISHYIQGTCYKS